MDTVLLIIVTVLLVWIGVSLARHQLKRSSGLHSSNSSQSHRSPYQKMIEDKQAGWHVTHQYKELVKRKALLKEAIQKGDTTQIKVQKSMMTFGKSLINNMQHKLRSISSE